MADSPGHRVGQFIGNLLEETLIRYCRPIAAECDMYLDYKHPRPARQNKSEVIWTDINGNTHKLDIVMEDKGSEHKIGNPKAFIEVAWRRYTKHSKNKAQEISAAITPLVSRYSEFAPFYGAVLAGKLTKNALKQMQSEGFKLLYFSTEAVEAAFASQGVEVHWEEDTSEEELQNRVDQLEALSGDQLQSIGDHLINNNQAQWDSFFDSLRNTLERKIEHISITALYGNAKVFYEAQGACDYIASGTKEAILTGVDPCCYEVVITYSNGEKTEMRYKERQEALKSLMRLV